VWCQGTPGCKESQWNRVRSRQRVIISTHPSSKHKHGRCDFKNFLIFITCVCAALSLRLHQSQQSCTVNNPSKMLCFVMGALK
jgi:hypothetical protein